MSVPHRRATRTRALFALLLVVLAASLAGPASSIAASPATAGAPQVVHKEACPDGSIFTCITIRVPRDHFSSAGGATFDVTFALHKAKAATRKGVFVTVTGGPGTSGISVADSYTSAFDQGIIDAYDLVFLDQRGVGLSQPIQCPDASLDFYLSPNVPTLSATQARAYAADSKTYVGDCLAEDGINPARLPFFSTRQAVEDLEAFRIWLKADKLDLYGESYGTQYAQTYAAAHPNRLHSLMLDGAVDLTLTGTQYYAEGAHAFEDTLVMTLDRCTDDRSCRSDVVGRNALKGYDDLAAKLKKGALPFTFVRSDGTTETRKFTFGDLEIAASGYVYNEFDRMLLQRAIAWASRGQLLPLARLSYLSLGQDPETLDAIPDPSYSDAMYYAVECMDYAYGTGSAANRVDQYLAAGVAAHVDRVRLGSIFYGDLPCAFWPSHPPTQARPDYLRSTPFPVFVLGSTFDPATAYPNAVRIASHLKDGYLIIAEGGPHVIFGRGNACPDDLITAFLVDGTRPSSRSIRCDFTGTDPYVSIPAKQVQGYDDALDAMTATDDEINTSADYWGWDGGDDLVYGCLFGGTIRYHAVAAGYRETLTGCAFTSGLPLTGTATINTNKETFRLDVTSPGGTKLSYRRDADGNTSVTGTWFGQPVSLAG
jgi:pimeloyl-ACP methyl ester carboxylesterase